MTLKIGPDKSANRTCAARGPENGAGVSADHFPPRELLDIDGIQRVSGGAVQALLSPARKPGTVEWRFAQLAERKEMADKKEPAAPVLGGGAPLAGAKPSTKSVKKGKLPPKNKSRLPRRQKKAQQKAAGRL